MQWTMMSDFHPLNYGPSNLKICPEVLKGPSFCGIMGEDEEGRE